MARDRSAGRKRKRVIAAVPGQPEPKDTQATVAQPAKSEKRTPPAPQAAKPAARGDYRGLIMGIALAFIAVIVLIVVGGGGGTTPTSSSQQPAANPSAGSAFAGIDATDAQQLMRRGKELYDQGKFDEAARVYQEVIRLQPENQAAQSNLGSTYFRLQRIDEALTAFQKAVDLNPNDAEARQNLGAGLAATGSFDAAIAQYLLAVQSKPDLAPAHYSLGVLYQEQGNKDKAISELKRFLELGGDSQLVSDAQRRLQVLGAQ